MVFNYLIFHFIDIRGIVESGVWNSVPGINAWPINWSNVAVNSLSDFIWLNGNILSLHDLQNQVLLLWIHRKSSCDSDVQLFPRQHWQRAVYAFRSVFLLHIGQMLISSFITDKIVDIHGTVICGLILYSGGNFQKHKSGQWELKLVVFDCPQVQ